MICDSLLVHVSASAVGVLLAIVRPIPPNATVSVVMPTSRHTGERTMLTLPEKMVLRRRSLNAVTQNEGLNRLMGHPIDPNDPVNGGIPTCLDYMPPQLYAQVWRWIGVPTYWDGIIDEFPEGSAKYGGQVFGVTPPQLFFVEFGILDPPRVQAWMDIAPFVPVFDTHCNLPRAFATPPETGPSFSAYVTEVP